VLTVADDGADEHGVTAPCELSDECDVSFPAWTPDGRLVVTVPDDRERPDVSRDPIRGGVATRAARPRASRATNRRQTRPLDRQADTPAVSPDGRVVLYTRSNHH
jgi:Tol biopolymer transport system component